MMPVVVAPAHGPLLGRLSGLACVLRVSDPALAAEAAARAETYRLNLTCITWKPAPRSRTSRSTACPSPRRWRSG